MKIHDLIQGSQEWLAYRAQHFNASDAPAMMGCSPYKTRAQLLRELHTGVAGDIDIGTQKRFDNGHRAEALARPLAEEFIGAELYPVTGSEGRLSASFDGLTLDETIGFEHKALNDELRAAFREMVYIAPELMERGEGALRLPLMHQVQMQQQLLISRAERVLFMASAWDPDGNLIEEQHCWCLPNEALQSQILSGWAQFERDLAAYVLPEATAPAPAGKAPETLPALRIEVTGQVTASNLAEFKQTALTAIRSVNRNLTTDADFADADKAVKWCADIESRLAAAKQHALSQTADIEALFRTMDDIGKEAREVRLELDKLVTRRKGEVKDQAVDRAKRALDAHIAALNAELAPMRLPQVLADFAAAIKGKRSIALMQDALDSVLAVAKIAADEDARAIRANVSAFKAEAEGFEFLFPDLGAFVHKAADDFKATLQARIANHKAAEERRRAEAERQRQEAEARAQQQREQEAARQAAEAATRAAQAAAPAPVNVAGPAHLAPQPAPGLAFDARGVLTPVGAAPRASEPATLNLGAICGRLGYTVSAAFLADVLHIQPAKVDKASRLYTERQFALICSQLCSHTAAMRELYAADEVAA